MKVAQLRETDRLEQNLSTLATIGSTSPYVGLFAPQNDVLKTVYGDNGVIYGGRLGVRVWRTAVISAATSRLRR